MEALGILLIPVLAFGFLFLVTIIDLFTRKDLAINTKLLWLVVLLLVPFLGIIIYCFYYKRRFVITALIITALGLVGFYGFKYYLKNKPHRDVTKEQGIIVTADTLFNHFTTNEAAANQKYLNKAIEVTGEVAEVKKNQDSNTVVVLKTSDPIFGVNCTFKEDPGAIQPGNTITFKGICTGFISDVVINEGVLVKK
jgi:hypothetical protein